MPIAPGIAAVSGTCTSCSEKPLVTRGAQAPLAVDIVGGKAGAIGLDKKSANPAAFILNLGKDNGHIGDGSRGDPHFFAVENVLVAYLAGRGGHGAGIGAGARLGEPEAAEFFSRWPARGSQVFFCSSEPKV